MRFLSSGRGGVVDRSGSHGCSIEEIQVPEPKLYVVFCGILMRISQNY
jgi:hypothetical protein